MAYGWPVKRSIGITQWLCVTPPQKKSQIPSLHSFLKHPSSQESVQPALCHCAESDACLFQLWRFLTTDTLVSLNPSFHSPEVCRLCSGVQNAALCSSHGQFYASTLCSWCPSRYWSKSRLHGHPRALGRRLQCHTLHTCGCSRLAWQRCGPWKRLPPWQRHSPCWVVRTWDNLVPQRTSWKTTNRVEK